MSTCTTLSATFFGARLCVVGLKSPPQYHLTLTISWFVPRENFQLSIFDFQRSFSLDTGQLWLYFYSGWAGEGL